MQEMKNIFESNDYSGKKQSKERVFQFRIVDQRQVLENNNQWVSYEFVKTYGPQLLAIENFNPQSYLSGYGCFLKQIVEEVKQLKFLIQKLALQIRAKNGLVSKL